MNLSASNTAIDPVLLDLFRTDLETNSRVLDEGLIQAEAEQFPDLMERLMRAAHSIKGAARMLAFEGAVRLAHAMEDVLAKAQRGGGRLSANQVEILLRSNDVFLHAAAEPPASIPARLESQAEIIAALIGELLALPVAAAVPGPTPPRYAPERMDAAALDLFRSKLKTHARALTQELGDATRRTREELEPLVRAADSIEGAAGMAGLDRPARLAHAVKEFLLAVQHGKGQPTAVHLEMLTHTRGVFLHLASCAAADIPAEIEKQTVGIDRVITDLSQPLAPVPGPPAKSVAAAEPEPTATDKAVRVTAESLNRLVGLAGECLVQTGLTRQLFSGLQHIKQWQATLEAKLERGMELLREGDHAAAQAELDLCLEQFREARDLIPHYLMDFADWRHRLEALVGPLYSEAVASRMRPFSDGTHGHSRMVHDLAKELGKTVRFEIDGASTPVDREILDRLEAPLTHLLRNGVDHGIELPASRTSRGKPEEGKLILSAHQVSGLLRIAVADDGAGIDISELRSRITAAGYVSEGIARELGETEILEFLFLPGFSTAKAVTETSGRGVGLDVVQSTVRALGGSAHIQTTVGAGTRIELHLPLTLSIVRALVVEVGKELYAIPLTRIDRLLRTTPESLELLEDRQFCTVDGQHVGVLEAGQVLNARNAGQPTAVCVVVISDRLSRYGLLVDRFVGERDLVVKPLPACLGKIANVSAGAILDDGTPVLILDTDDLVRAMDSLLSGGVLHKVSSPAEPVPAHPRRRVLVVDDSLTVREVERRLLENHGYEVEVAIDGGDAWNILQRSSFDLLVTDVDMPRMDGLELVRHVRAAPRLAALPVVIVSYKEQPECRIQGMEAGANYYLTKSSFHDESLLTAVRDLIGEAAAHADSNRE